MEFEEAEKERDLSLDLSQLEIRKKRSKKDSYEHVSLAAAGGVDYDTIAGTNIVPKPTITLLRNFDPCFGTQEEDNEDNDCDVSEDLSPEYEDCDVIYDQIDDLKIDKSPIQSDLAIPKIKFPVGSPKKINFGPPKPPRNFPPSPKKEEVRTPVKPSSSVRNLKSMLSESSLLKRGGKAAAEARVSPSPVAGEDNIYVTAPVWHSRDATTDPGASPSPPPLPSTLPPSAPPPPRPQMYENVWVEPLAGPPLPPRANKPTEGIVINNKQANNDGTVVTKTGKLEEIFSNRSRKMSQESLVSHGSAPGRLIHLLTHSRK